MLTKGRAYELPQVIPDAAAIVVARRGGPFGPQAVADVLFGAIEPSRAEGCRTASSPRRPSARSPLPAGERRR